MHPARPMTSSAFERQIHRIVELLEGSGAEVVWNDHIPDPDNPRQKRQIDVTIRRADTLMLCECRLSGSRQDVKWVEELIGRRQSLEAHAVIAVSSSGFTRGAINKAKRYDVILRDLRELTDKDVELWGRRVALTLYFYEYSNLEVSLVFEHESIPRIDNDILRVELLAHPARRALFNAAATNLDTGKLLARNLIDRPVEFGVTLLIDSFYLCGERVIEVDFRGTARLITRPISSQVVTSYGPPASAPPQREATVERFDLGETAIVHDSDRISMLLDISHLEMPPLCQFRFFRVTGQEEMDYETLELAGVEKLWVNEGKIAVNICSN